MNICVGILILGLCLPFDATNESELKARGFKVTGDVSDSSADATGFRAAGESDQLGRAVVLAMTRDGKQTGLVVETCRDAAALRKLLSSEKRVSREGGRLVRVWRR